MARPEEFVFELFESLAACALGEKPGYRESLEVLFWQFDLEPGTYLLQFFPDRDRAPFQMGVFPASKAQGDALLFFRKAVEDGCGLSPVDPDQYEALLRAFQTALFDRAPDMVEFPLPIDNQQVGRALVSAMFEPRLPAALDHPEESPALKGPPATFRGLALDVLSGRAQPHTGTQDREDSFEVWADLTQPLATLIVRFFDGGRVAAVAALMPRQMRDDTRFKDAVHGLLSNLADLPLSTQTGRAEASGLTLLRPLVAAERLGLALGSYAEGGGVTLEPGLTGEPSDRTLSHLSLLGLMDPDREDCGLLPDSFHAGAMRWLEERAEIAWSAERESANVERIEILRHPDYTLCLALLHFHCGRHTALISVYQAEDPAGDTFVAFLRELLALARQRRLSSRETLPLPSDSSFVRVEDAEAEQRLAQALVALQSNSGLTHQIIPRDMANREEGEFIPTVDVATDEPIPAKHRLH